MKTFGFESMTHGELMGFWDKYRRGRKNAEALVGRRKGFTNIAASLANIACNMAVWRACRDKGDHDGAAIYKKCAELGRDALPEDLRPAVVIELR